jgi:SpoVK/Ycf46/Vps4 family AAA+-type ATPase
LQKFSYQPSDDEDDFLDWLVSSTDGFTSADLKGLIQNAQLAKMSEVLKNEEKRDNKIDDSIEPDFRI